MAPSKLSGELQKRVVAAIRSVQKEIRWKPGKDVAHLETRKDWQHLPDSASLDDYQVIIQTVLRDDEAQVYLYHHGDTVYPTVVTEIDHTPWLVMFALDGILETAFVVEWPDKYLGKHEFELIGTLEEVLE